MRRIFGVLGLLTLALAFSQEARAQASCPIAAPRTITASSYTLTNNDECAALVFTSTSPVTVSAPVATAVAPGFQVMLITINNGLTVSSAGTGSNIGVSTAQMIGAGQSGILLGDGSNYWWGGGSGFGFTPAAVSGFAQSGTNWSNSNIVTLPNGVLQITNPASIVPDNNTGAFAVCKGGAIGAALGPAGQTSRGAPSWWQVLDPIGRAFKIPLC